MLYRRNVRFGNCRIVKESRATHEKHFLLQAEEFFPLLRDGQMAKIEHAIFFFAGINTEVRFFFGACGNFIQNFAVSNYKDNTLYCTAQRTATEYFSIPLNATLWTLSK